MKFSFINGNGIKLLAAVLMVIDHIGAIFFPQIVWLRCVGRISFPLFAYMLAVGCKYTRNKVYHFLLLSAAAAICQSVYFAVTGSLRLNIFFTFALSALLIYCLRGLGDCIMRGAGALICLLPCMAFAGMVFLTYLLCSVSDINGVPFGVEYGFWGCMLPVFPAAADVALEISKAEIFPSLRRFACIFSFAAGLVLLSAFHSSVIQWYCMFSLVPLVFYNGMRGKLNLKYFFYIFYPAHLALFYLISLLI